MLIENKKTNWRLCVSCHTVQYLRFYVFCITWNLEKEINGYLRRSISAFFVLSQLHKVCMFALSPQQRQLLVTNIYIGALDK